jgi:hypothetical protein
MRPEHDAPRTTIREWMSFPPEKRPEPSKPARIDSGATGSSDEKSARLFGFGRLNSRTRFGSRQSLDSALVRRGPRLGLRCSGWAHRRTGFATGQPWNSGAAVWLGAARSLPGSRLVGGLGKCCGRSERNRSCGQEDDLPHGVSFRVRIWRGKFHWCHCRRLLKQRGCAYLCSSRADFRPATLAMLARLLEGCWPDSGGVLRSGHIGVDVEFAIGGRRVCAWRWF